MQHLLAAGAKVCVRDRDQAVPLHLATLSGSQAVLHLLILNGAGLEDRDSLHMTPLHYSTLKDNAEAAKLLLHYGADVDATERLGRTPLHLATERGHCKVAFSLSSHHVGFTLHQNTSNCLVYSHKVIHNG